MENKPYLAVYADTGEPVIFGPRAYCPNTLAMAMALPVKRSKPKRKRRKR